MYMSEESMQREDLELLFDKAVKYARDEKDTISSKVTNEQKLNFYALYKQATVGDCNTERPGGLFNWERKSMWDSWNELKFKFIKNPKKMYVDYLTSIMSDWNTSA
jgi:diazepam-binding inhibitor (GABA receptor modulator, acyl-CoA-binding protein)